jgi:hypothetical protein
MKTERDALDVAPVVRILRSERFRDLTQPEQRIVARFIMAGWPGTEWWSMAKAKTTTTTRPARERVLGQTREDLLRGLGLNELTREAYLRGVFGDLLDDPGAGGEEWTVT